MGMLDFVGSKKRRSVTEEKQVEGRRKQSSLHSLTLGTVCELVATSIRFKEPALVRGYRNGRGIWRAKMKGEGGVRGGVYDRREYKLQVGVQGPERQPIKMGRLVQQLFTRPDGDFESRILFNDKDVAARERTDT